MNRTVQQQQITQKQMREQQARLLAARQRDMLGAAWWEAQARKTGLQALRREKVTPAPAEKGGRSATRILFWLIAAAAAIRLLASL